MARNYDENYLDGLIAKAKKSWGGETLPIYSRTIDMMNKIIDDVCGKQVSTLEKLVVDAFENHFRISIYDVNLREIEHIRVEGDPIESYRYRGETFLYVKVPFDIDVNTDSQGVKLKMTYKYKEV